MTPHKLYNTISTELHSPILCYEHFTYDSSDNSYYSHDDSDFGYRFITKFLLFICLILFRVNETMCVGGMCIVRSAAGTTGFPHGMQWNGQNVASCPLAGRQGYNNLREPHQNSVMIVVGWLLFISSPSS